MKRGYNQIFGSGSRPNLDRDGMNQDHFGIDTGTRFPSGAVNWQSQPMRKTNPTHTYPLLFKPTPNNPQKHWTTSQPLFMLKELGKQVYTLYSLAEVIYHLRHSSEKFYRNIASANQDEDDGILPAFKSVENFDKYIAFVGVAYSMPDPSLQDGIYSNQYSGVTADQSSALAITITTHGHCFFPDVFSSPYPIEAGQKLFMIIKKVAADEAHEYRHYETGHKIQSALADANTKLAKLSCLDIVFYTHPSNEIPTYIDYQKSIEDSQDPDMQTSKNCRMYKEQTDDVGDNNKEKMILKEGIVYCIGHTLHSYRPLRGNSYATKGWSCADVLKLRKLEINLNIQRV